jgi:hypothetical protein
MIENSRVRFPQKRMGKFTVWMARDGGIESIGWMMDEMMREEISTVSVSGR